MFIAVQRYGEKTKQIHDKVAIFDTEDGTVELISYIDMKNLIHDGKLSIENLIIDRDRVQWRSLTTVAGDVTIQSKIISFPQLGFVLYKNWVLEIDSNRTIRKCNGVDFGGFTLPSIDIAYMFSFRDYLVLRCYDSAYGKWYSVAFSDKYKIECMWYKDMSVVIGDKSLALRVDTVCEV